MRISHETSTVVKFERDYRMVVAAS